MIDTEPIHTYFGLSYGTHHVLDAKTMAAMPQSWHARFQEVCEIYRRAVATLPQMPDRYLAVAATVCEYGDLSAEDLHRLKITPSSDVVVPDDEHRDDESDAEFERRERAWQQRRDDQVFYDDHGDEHQSNERLYVPDPDDDLLDVAPFRLVWPRTILQSMPTDWQAAFVRLMKQADEVACDLDLPRAYQVRAQRRAPGGWVDITDPVEHYDRGRARLALAS